MITEEQYKRFGIYDQIVDLVADRMKLKSVFETPSALARMRNDPRVLELLQRMLRRLDRLDDSVTAIWELLPPSEKSADEEKEEKTMDESHSASENSASQTSNSDLGEVEVVSEKSHTNGQNDSFDDADDANTEGKGVDINAAAGGDEENTNMSAVEKCEMPAQSKPKTFKLKCPHCNQILEAEEEWRGKLAECSYCNKQFPIPPVLVRLETKHRGIKTSIKADEIRQTAEEPDSEHDLQNQDARELPETGNGTAEEKDEINAVYQCGSCGKTCSADAKFCSECGGKVELRKTQNPQPDDANEPASPQPSSENSDIVVDSIRSECKVNVIKAVRDLTNMGLADAKEFVENLPSTLIANIPTAKAEEMKGLLEKAGALVYLEPSELPDAREENDSAQGKKNSETTSDAGCSLAVLFGTCLFISIWAFFGFWHALIISVGGSIILNNAFSTMTMTRKAQLKHPVAVAFILGGTAFYIVEVNLGTWQAFVCAIGIMIVWGVTYCNIFAGDDTGHREEKGENDEDEEEKGEPDADEQCVADTDSSAEWNDNTGHEFTCPSCGRKKFVPDSFIGQHTRCKCGQTFPTTTIPDKQTSDDLHSENRDDELPKIKLTAQAKKGEEWLKKNLCNGEDPAVFLLNRFCNHTPLMTRDEMSKLTRGYAGEYVKAYLTCHQEWVANVIAYKQSKTKNKA